MGGLKEGSKEDHQGEKGRGPPRGVRAALLLSCHPAHCQGEGGGCDTTKGTGVCGVRSDKEKRGAGETNR